MLDLERIYRETLRRCSPETLIVRCVTPGMPRNVVAIGKCAGALLDGFAGVVPVDAAFVALPRGYPAPKSGNALVMYGGHPEMDGDSFRAGAELLRFVDRHRDITFLISGGGSACVEVPLAPFTEADVAAANRRLVRSGRPIAEINAERRKLSAIKGGRLGARVRGRSVSLIFSDVSTGDLASVASGPALAEATLIADNTTLVTTAAMLVEEEGWRAVRHPHQIEGDVSAAARELAGKAAALETRHVLIAGGEPSVRVQGSGKGGRCSELAVRFALEIDSPKRVLFGSSDGVDGNSGVAGIVLDLPVRLDVRLDAAAARAALAASDSFRIAAAIGRPIIMPPTGNNLRDLYLVACS